MYQPDTIVTRRSQRLRGFTLLELLLVLVLLAIIAAFVLPRLSGSVSRRQLQTAAQQLKADWSRARSVAIRNGVTQLFLYRTDGRSYVVVSDAIDAESLALFDQAKQELLQRDPEVELPTHAAMGVDAGQLPYRIRRLPIDILFFLDAYADDRDTASVPQAEEMTSSVASVTDELIGANNLAVLAFHPDGTTSPASIILRNQKQEMIYLMLRGLTGTVTIGDVQRGELIQ